MSLKRSGNPLPLGGGAVKFMRTSRYPFLSASGAPDMMAPKRKLNLRDGGLVYREGALMPPDDFALPKATRRPSSDRVLVYTGGLLLALALLWTLLG